MNFLGIYREPEYSPGRHASNDARILRLVGQALERENLSVMLAPLEEARRCRRGADLIFSMCQGPQAVQELIEWKRDGSFILNDPEASRRTYRDQLCAVGQTRELGFPKSDLLSTAAEAMHPSADTFFNEGGAWLKRADVHATQTGDVMFVEDVSALAQALAAFRARGLSQAILQEHCAGDEVKFYAVRGGRLFWPFYPKESEGHPFDEKALHVMAERAAQALDLSIYGGDAMISPDGHITLIDINDWPSFAPCRGAAAHAIAHYLKDTYYALEKHRQTSPL